MASGTYPLISSGTLIAIDFAKHGNSASYRRDGWSAQEPQSVWSVGPRSHLSLPIIADDKDLVLDLEVSPCRALPEITAQILRVLANGTLLGSVILTQRAFVRCRIPATLLSSDRLQIEFEHPTFWRPDYIGKPRDTRLLAISFFTVKVYSKDLFEGDLPVRRELPLLTLDSISHHPSSARPSAPAERLNFGEGGTGLPYLRDGWHRSEHEFTWTDGHFSRIELPVPEAASTLLLVLDVKPITLSGGPPTQKITLVANGCAVGQFEVNNKIELIVLIPRELVQNCPFLSVTFIIPTAVSPKDFGGKDDRVLGVALFQAQLSGAPPFLCNSKGIRQKEAGVQLVAPPVVSSRFLQQSLEDLPKAIEEETGYSIDKLLLRFESLGDNCEFGIVQRKMGVEVLNLLRFGNAQLSSLRLALEDNFSAAADSAAIEFSLNNSKPREYVVSIPAYNIRWHTFVYEGVPDVAEIQSAQISKLNYLRRKFYEGLKSGKKIYVLKRYSALKLDEVLPILLALNRDGSGNKLLCILPVEGNRVSGEVELILPMLMFGYISKFAPNDDVEGGTDPTEWLRIIGNAMMLEMSQSKAEGKGGAETQRGEFVTRPADKTNLVTLPLSGTRERPTKAEPPGAHSLSELLSRFESLGENCEFGLLQRRCEIETPGLLRFTSAPYSKLMTALQEGFQGLGRPEKVEIQVPGNSREYMVFDKQFGFLWHSWVLVGEKTEEDVYASEIQKCPFLVRKMVDDLRRAEKIFVYHGMRPLTLAQGRDLSAALRRYGPVTLLWVEVADSLHKAGSVEYFDTGLLKGYVDRFAPGDNAHDFSAASWIDVCREAYRLWTSK